MAEFDGDDRVVVSEVLLEAWRFPYFDYTSVRFSPPWSWHVQGGGCRAECASAVERLVLEAPLGGRQCVLNFIEDEDMGPEWDDLTDIATDRRKELQRDNAHRTDVGLVLICVHDPVLLALKPMIEEAETKAVIRYLLCTHLEHEPE